MQKKQKNVKKMRFKDHIIYFFVYIFLFPFAFSLPLVILLRDSVLLNSHDVLSYSTGWGGLWCIPSMMIVFVAIAYFGWCEKHALPVKQAIRHLFCKHKTRFVVVLCIIFFLISILLSLLSDWCEFRLDGFYDCNVLGTKERVGSIEDIHGVKWHFDSAYISDGRYGSVQVSLVCEIQLNGETLSFDRFKLSNLLLMIDALKNLPCEILNGELAEKWISAVDCDDIMREELRQTFFP